MASYESGLMTGCFITIKTFFTEILRDNWERFKALFPSYADRYYDEVMTKVFGCTIRHSGSLNSNAYPAVITVRSLLFRLRPNFV